MKQRDKQNIDFKTFSIFLNELQVERIYVQSRFDSMDDNKIWAVSFRRLDDLDFPTNKTIQTGHLLTACSGQRVQRGDSSGLQVQRLRDRKSLESRVASPKMEERYRKWLVCLSASVVMLIDGSFLQAFGTLFIDIMEEFQTTRASAAVIQSVLIGISLGAGVLCGVLVNRFGPRKIGLAGGILFPAGFILAYFANGVLMLGLTIGVISGLGSCFLYISNTAAIGLNFDGQSKILALSLASTWSGLGAISCPFLLRYLREKYGLQETFLIVGGLALNTIPCAMLWGAPAEKGGMNDHEADGERSIRAEVQQESSRQKRHESLQLIASLLRSAPYILFVLGNMCTTAPLTMYTILITDIYDQKGFGKADSTFGISLMNICSFFGRLAPGILKQIPKFSALYTPIICSALGAILMTSVNLTLSLAATYVVSAGLGIFFGVFISTITVTTVSLIGPELFATGVGLLFTMNGVTNLAIAPLSGLVKDVTQSYESVLYGATVLMAFGCGSFCVAFWLRRRKNQEENC